MVITEEQKKQLEKYNIEISDVKNILLELDDEMTDHLDENDEPLPEFYEIQKLYDEIYKQNQ